MLQFHRKWRLNEWQNTGCILGVIWYAAALSISVATLRATITPRLPKASEIMSVMKEAGLLAEPRLKEELRAAARRARERAEQLEMLADAQKEVTSDPEEQERGRTQRRERRRTRSSSGERRRIKEIKR